ncbi:hypothetical protein BC830DRAFT_1132250 [Chytriomyces sp. MP71]|nr:hypothetical protein BC830DRAFT_1132250 [Chytriomyces sp. MP71]
MMRRIWALVVVPLTMMTLAMFHPPWFQCRSHVSLSRARFNRRLPQKQASMPFFHGRDGNATLRVMMLTCLPWSQLR